jgi:hypothetical protein
VIVNSRVYSIAFCAIFNLAIYKFGHTLGKAAAIRNKVCAMRTLILALSMTVAAIDLATTGVSAAIKSDAGMAKPGKLSAEAAFRRGGMRGATVRGRAEIARRASAR